MILFQDTYGQCPAKKGRQSDSPLKGQVKILKISLNAHCLLLYLSFSDHLLSFSV